MKTERKIAALALAVMLMTAWFFSGWPPIWHNPRIPPSIKQALAAPPIPSYRASGTFTAGTGAITPPYPASMAANDVCLLVVESENQPISLSAPQGFVEVPNSPQFAGTAATNPANRIAVFWKRTVGGDTAPTVADSGNHTTGQIHCFFNVTTVGNPWDVTAGGNDGGANDTSGVIPGATTTVANTLVVLIQGTSNNANSTANCSGWTNANLANLLERTDNSNTAGLGGGHCMATGEKATAGAYGNTTVTLSVTTFKGALSIALKPVAPTYNQSAYRFFNNTDSTNVGTPLAAQDTAATLSSSGAAFRLRMLLHIGNDPLPQNGESFKLQFAQRGTDNLCDTGFVGETYADVTAATVIAYNDNPTPADGATLTANAEDPIHGADTIVNQTYEELNNFTNSVADIPSNQDGKWDFALKDNNASSSTTYCFRAVKSDNSLLDSYSVIPEVTTASAGGTITLTLSTTTVALGILVSGTPNTATSSAVVNASNLTSGYSLQIKRDDATSTLDLTTDANIDFPDYTAWSPGAFCSSAGNATTTPGATLSFRVNASSTSPASMYCDQWWGATDTDGTALYAGFPSTSQQISNCNAGGVCNNGTSTTILKYRADMPASQQSGAYDGTITITAIAN